MAEIAAIAKIAKQTLFECVKCKYLTHNRYDYNKHCKTIKHNQDTDEEEKEKDKDKEKGKEREESKIFTCPNCNKIYKDNSGLWKHRKLCKPFLNDIDNDLCKDNKDLVLHNNTQHLANQITPELILSVLEQNKELTNLVVEQNKTIMELAKNGQGSTNISNNINSHNKTFNLQFFLNETCKDAMNITDFVDSLKLQLSDLENVGKVGFVEGISSIIVKNLKALDVHKRPVHCADKKREIIYIKDEDKWEKEDADKNKMRKVIKNVADKNQRLLSKYKEEHPRCNFSESKYSDQYSKIVIEAMGGAGNNDAEKEDKIIQKIAKEVVIDKKYQC
jgi:uncharacterized C2H2 Zn-finger protein